MSVTDASLTDAPDAGEELRGLFYPHGRFVPREGSLFEVAGGVFWLRMPLPMALNHINLWVLEDEDGWAIVDTGLNMPDVVAHWRALLDGPLGGRPVRRVIVTHYHPDHIGLAGWLCRKFQVPLEITREEYLLARTLTLDTPAEVPPEVIEFYRRAGWPDEAMAIFNGGGWGNFGRAVSRLPSGHLRLRAGQVLRIGGRDWRIVHGNGHSPEHACLVCDADGLMIAGDQVLPRITSNISVYPTEPRADPLADWMDSLDRLSQLDAGMRVLPAHNEPFEGLHVRLEQLRDDHLRKLSALTEFCAEPRTVYDTFPVLFRRPVAARETMMASGEALAHLHWLENKGEVVRDTSGPADRYIAA